MAWRHRRSMIGGAISAMVENSGAECSDTGWSRQRWVSNQRTVLSMASEYRRDAIVLLAAV
jgi:hypothetical protein